MFCTYVWFVCVRPPVFCFVSHFLLFTNRVSSGGTLSHSRSYCDSGGVWAYAQRVGASAQSSLYTGSNWRMNTHS